MNFFDQVFWHCKNTTLLKFYEYEEAIDSVIGNFYYFIEKKKYVEVQRNGEPNEDLMINAKVLEYCFKNNLNGDEDCPKAMNIFIAMNILRTMKQKNLKP